MALVLKQAKTQIISSEYAGLLFQSPSGDSWFWYVMLIVVGVLLWLVNTYIPFQSPSGDS